MRVGYRMFKSHLQSWDAMFAEAADYASGIGPDRLISISHSEDQGQGVVTVWYWQGTPGADLDPRPTTEELDQLVEQNLRNIES